MNGDTLCDPDTPGPTCLAMDVLLEPTPTPTHGWSRLPRNYCPPGFHMVGRRMEMIWPVRDTVAAAEIVGQ